MVSTKEFIQLLLQLLHAVMLYQFFSLELSLGFYFQQVFTIVQTYLKNLNNEKAMNVFLIIYFIGFAGPLSEQLLQGPIGIAIGIVYGFLFGLFVSIVPSKKSVSNFLMNLFFKFYQCNYFACIYLLRIIQMD